MPSRAKPLSQAPTATAPAADAGDSQRWNSLIEIVALAGLSILGVLALLPSADEKTAALIADKRFPQAISLLEGRARGVALNTYETFSLARLYRQIGDDAKAQPMLEEMLKADPKSPSVLRELADLYGAQGRPADEARVLQQLFESAPDAETNDRLIALFHQQGDTAAVDAQLTAAGRAGIATKAMPDTEIVSLANTDKAHRAI